MLQFEILTNIPELVNKGFFLDTWNVTFKKTE